MARPSEDDNSFFFDTYVPLCQQAFRFNHFVTRSAARSFSCVLRITEEFYDELRRMEDSDKHLAFIVRNCWRTLDKTPSMVKPIEKDLLGASINAISPEERGYLAAMDCLGLTADEAKSIFKLPNTKEADKLVEDTRQKVAKDRAYTDIKPQIQEGFRAITMQDSHRQKLCNLILPGYDPDATETKVGKDAEANLRGQRLRNYAIVAFIVAVIGLYVYYYQRETNGEAKVIEWIGYETLAIEEEPDRLKFPSTNLREITSYFDNNPNLEIKPRVVSLAPAWRPQAAGIIDYDFVIVSAIRYQHRSSQDTLFLYEFKTKSAEDDELSDGDFNYRSYASDDLNMIAWSNKDAVSVLAGRLGTEDLVNIGKKFN